MDISEVKQYVGKTVYLCDERHRDKNVPYFFRAYLFEYGQNGKYIHKARLEDLNCGRSVREVRLEDIFAEKQL